MNTLSLDTASVIGSSGDILSLRRKERARLLVVSDSHGGAEVLRKIVTDFGDGCDCLVFCGDGICDVVALVEEASCDGRLAAAIPPVVVCARGNGDGEQYPVAVNSVRPDDGPGAPVVQYFSVQPTVMLCVAGRNLMCVHGHRHGVDLGTDTLSATAESMDADMVFFGHTHRICREESGPTLLLNPGSCARPRGGLPPTFAVVSFPGGTERYNAEFFAVRETLFGGYGFSAVHV